MKKNINHRFILKFIAFFVIMGLLLVGCAQQQPSPAEEAEPAEQPAEEAAPEESAAESAEETAEEAAEAEVAVAEEPAEEVEAEVAEEDTEEAAEMAAGELTPRDLKIGYVFESANYQHAQQVSAGANEMAKALGVEFIITDADFDRSKMIADLDAVIEQQPDAIIIDHGGDGLTDGVNRALEQGIPVVVFDNQLPDVEGDIVRLAQDDYDLAFKSLKALIEDIDGEGEIAVVWVGGFAPMEKRQRVLDIMLANFPNVEVVSTYGEASANTVADALAKTEAALNANPDIEAIWATWDQFALGVHEALVQSGRTDVGLYSIDISAEDVAKMREENSPWLATAAADAREVGRVATRMAVNAAYGLPNPAYVEVPAFLATQDQIRQLPEGEIPTSGPTTLGWNDWLWELYQMNDPAGAEAAQAALGVGGNVAAQEASKPLPAELAADFETQDLTFAYVMESANYQHAQQVLAGANEMADRFGVELIVTDADFDRSKMIADLDAVIEQQPDVILVDHGGDGLTDGVNRALEQGIPVVVFDNQLPDVEGDIVRLAQDDYDLAFKSLKALIEDIDGEGEIAVVWVGGFAPMEKRQRVLDIMLANFPNVEVVSTYGEASANTVADALAKTEAALNANPDIEAIWATWDQFALGVHEALVQSGRTDVGLYSIDISAEDVAKMREENSPWRMTAAADAREVGRVMIRLGVNAAYDQDLPSYLEVPAFVATQEQVRSIPEGEIPTAGPTTLGWTPFLVALDNLE